MNFTWKSFCVILALLCGFSVFARDPEPERKVRNDTKKLYIDEQMRLADGLMKRGHLDLAIREYQALIKRFPESELVADAFSQLGEALAQKGDMDGAYKIYREFLKRFPGVPTRDMVRIRYAKWLFESSREKDRSIAVNILKGYAQNGRTELLREAAMYNLAKTLARDNARENSVDLFEILAGKPVTSDRGHIYRVFAHLELAFIYREDGKHEEALAVLGDILDSDTAPEDVLNTALQLHAAILLDRKDYAGAVEAYEKLALLFPDSEPGRRALLGRLEALFLAGRHDRIIADAEKLLEDAESNLSDLHRIKYIYGKSCARLEFFEKAVKAFKEVLRDAEDESLVLDAACDYLRVLVKQDMSRKYNSEIDRFMSDNRFDDPARDRLISIVLPFLSPEKQTDILQNAVDDARSMDMKAYFQLRLAGELKSQKQYKKAVSAYRQAQLSEGRESPDAVYGTAECLESMGRESEALEMYADIERKFPGSAHAKRAIFNSALIHLNRDAGSPRSMELLEKLLDSSGEDDVQLRASALFYLGCISFHRSKMQNAEEFFLKAATMDPVSEALKINAELYLGWSLLKQDKTNQAMKLFDRLRDTEGLLNAAHPELAATLGRAYLEMKEYRRAGEIFQHLYDRNSPKLKQQALIGFADIFIAEGKSGRAIDVLREAEKIKGDPVLNCRAAVRLGELLHARGKSNEALFFFQKTVEAPADKFFAAKARLGLAGIMAGNKDRESIETAGRYAMSVFVLSDDPELAREAMLLSIRISLELGEKDKAQETFNELKKRYPDSPELKEAAKITELENR